MTRPSDSQPKKRTCQIVDFTVLADHRVKIKESEKRDKYLDFTRELEKKSMDMKVTVIPIVVGALGTIHKGLVKELENLEIRHYSIFKIGWNTEKSPEDFRRLAVTQTPVWNHQLMSVWKTLKWVNNNNNNNNNKNCWSKCKK